MRSSSVPSASSDDMVAVYRRLNAERKLGRTSPHTLRAAWWTLRSVRRARRDLKLRGLATTVSAPPASLPWGSRTGVNGVLNRLEPTCLERALVLQAWLHAHRVDRDVVIGVKGAQGEVRAHAWLDGIGDRDEGTRYSEIHRLAAPR
jgi:hypothetical protein